MASGDDGVSPKRQTQMQIAEAGQMSYFGPGDGADDDIDHDDDGDDGDDDDDD